VASRCLSRVNVTARVCAGRDQQVIVGYSGTGRTTDLRKVIGRENIWEKHNLSIKSVYFNSGSWMSRAMLGSSIAASEHYGRQPDGRNQKVRVF